MPPEEQTLAQAEDAYMRVLNDMHTEERAAAKAAENEVKLRYVDRIAQARQDLVNARARAERDFMLHVAANTAQRKINGL